MSAFSMRQRDARRGDLQTLDLLPACPSCGDLCAPGATICECGERLVPRPSSLPARHGRDCPCTPCTLAVYDEGLAL